MLIHFPFSFQTPIYGLSFNWITSTLFKSTTTHNINNEIKLLRNIDSFTTMSTMIYMIFGITQPIKIFETTTVWAS